MQNTILYTFLGIAAVILLLKKYLIANISSHFMIGDHIKESLKIYKRIFLYTGAQLKARKKIKYKDWVETYTTPLPNKEKT